VIGGDTFVATFGGMAAADDDHLPGVVRMACRHGYAIVVVAPGGKKPICTLTARQAKAADLDRQEDLRQAGRRWVGVKHECGIEHAMTDPTVADRVVKRMLKDRGSINIGIEVGRSRLVMVDADTDEQVRAFVDTWAAEQPDKDLSHLRPTVLTPGVVKVDKETGESTWVHKDGGHFWFTVPEGIDLAALPGQGSLRDADGGWVVVWRNHQALVPPSVRPEGAYRIAGEVGPAPEWLLDRIQMAAHSWIERKAQQATRVRHDGDPIDMWSAATGWTALLGPDGWTDTGKPDRCGCPIWTRPGDAAHYKSATAHELGCTRYEVEETGGGPLHIWTDDPPSFLATAVDVTGRRTFSKLQYVAWRDHDGGMGAAMAALELTALGDDGEVAAELVAILDALAAGQPAPVVEHVVERVPDPEAEPEAETDDELAVTLPPPPEPPPREPDPLAVTGLEAYRGELEASKRLRLELARLYTTERAKEIRAEVRGSADLGQTRDRHAAALDQASDLPEDTEDGPWRVRELWMQGQIVMLAAKYKAGKTTMVLNVVRSLVDGKPFLGQFDTEPLTGNLLIVNAEMTRRQFRRWLRDSPIENRDKVYVLHVREAGTSAGDIVTPAYRELLIETLIRCDAQALVLDPLNPMLAAAGIEENASSEVAAWFNALADVIKRSGVQDVLLVHHFGHVGDRGRGSSKFMDAPDALWTYTVGELPAAVAGDEDPTDDGLLADIAASLAAVPRYLAATGRDVDLAKSRVMYDDTTRLLTMPVVGSSGGVDTRAARREQAAIRRRAVTDVIASNPGIKITELRRRVVGKNTEINDALQEAVLLGEVLKVTTVTANGHETHSYTVAS